MNFSSFNIISGSEEGSILFLQTVAMFEMKENASKRKHRIPEFSHKREEKRSFNNLTIKLADRESFLV